MRKNQGFLMDNHGKGEETSKGRKCKNPFLVHISYSQFNLFGDDKTTESQHFIRYWVSLKKATRLLEKIKKTNSLTSLVLLF